jgi:hypothetical protein
MQLSVCNIEQSKYLQAADSNRNKTSHNHDKNFSGKDEIILYSETLPDIVSTSELLLPSPWKALMCCFRWVYLLKLSPHSPQDNGRSSE